MPPACHSRTGPIAAFFADAKAAIRPDEHDDQIRSIDTDSIVGDPVHYLEHDELAEVEHAVSGYLGL
jgi:hypothetical protein